MWYDRDTALPVRIRAKVDEQDRWIVNLFKVQTGVKIKDEIFDTTPPPPSEEGWQVQINRLEE